MAEWFDDDALWADIEPFIFAEKMYQNAPLEAEQAIALAGLKPSDRVLDLPCGPGRHAVELAKRGMSVTGVDRTAAFLRRARDRAASAGVAVELVQADMREFTRPGEFDAVLNLYTSFGYFRDPADDRRAARAMHDSLKPGGRLVMDLMGREVLARQFRQRDWREHEGTILLEERTLAPDWTWIDNRWLMLKGDQRREVSFWLRLYGAADLSALLHQVGFVVERVLGSLAGAAYDATATRLVVVASRPT
ncbi:MAG: class I SAM-dependent methyltransferase [Phycisphaerae bacterium]|nr:class I SAM-dependent methyltransferase [Phycisphaerae bacterium]